MKTFLRCVGVAWLVALSGGLGCDGGLDGSDVASFGAGTSPNFGAPHRVSNPHNDGDSARPGTLEVLPLEPGRESRGPVRASEAEDAPSPGKEDSDRA